VTVSDIAGSKKKTRPKHRPGFEIKAL